MTERLSQDPKVRLRVFQEAGLVPHVPNTWQLLQGQLEMAPYVALPDGGDQERYAGTLLGHPLLRTPLVFFEIGPDHFRIGHGLGLQAESLFKHLAIVYHEGMPSYDLQLAQTIPGGLARLRNYLEEIDSGATWERRRQRARIDLVVPNAADYRRQFLEQGGWIDRAEAFDYPEEVEPFLRVEFTSLVNFVNYCHRTYPESPLETGSELPSHLWSLASSAFRDRYWEPKGS